MMRKLWKNLKSDRGSAMVIVIVVIAFISILIATLFTLSTMNIQMKSVDRKAKGNFYSAEGALEQISLGLQDEISKASGTAYAEVMKSYAGKASEAERRALFNSKFTEYLTKELEGANPGSGEYDITDTGLKAYLSSDVATYTVLDTSKDCKIDTTSTDSLVLKGLVIKYTDAQNYETVIDTDIRLTAPNMNLVHASDMPELFDYTIIANQGLVGASTGAPVNIKANVYAGKGGLVDKKGDPSAESGLQLKGVTEWKFQNAKRLVVDGNVEIENSSLTSTTNIDLWAKEIQLEDRAKLDITGRTYVANDLLIKGNYTDTTIAGEYYGYGDNREVTDGSHVIADGKDNSAILINGHDTKLNMQNVRELLVAGNAQITTISDGYTGPGGDHDVVMHPENDPSLDELPKRDAVLAQGAYTLESVGAGKYARSEGNCLRAVTDLDDINAIKGNEDAAERFILVRNTNGTVSFMDRVKKQYLTLAGEPLDALVPAAGAVGPSEEFYAYTVEGRLGQVVLQSASTKKYVTVVPPDPSNPDDDYKLVANRDKITNKWQFFRLQRIGEVITLPPVEPPITSNDQLVTFTYSNSSNYVVSLSIPEWEENTSNDDAQAWIYYELPPQNGGWTDKQFKPMPMRNGGKRAIEQFVIGNGRDRIEYTIYYTLNGKLEIDIPANAEQAKAKMDELIANNQPGLAALPGVFNKDYEQARGQGNSQEVNCTFVNGVYTMKMGNAGNFAGVTGSAGQGPVMFNVPKAPDSPGGYESTPADDAQNAKFLLKNNKNPDGTLDGTFSIRSLVGEANYLSLNSDGTLTATARTIGPNEKFTFKSLYELKHNDDNLVVLQSMPNSNGKGKLIIPQENGIKLVDLSQGSNISENNALYLQWIGYKDTVNPILPEDPDVLLPPDVPYANMVYNTETSSKASFSSMMWVPGDPVTMYYEVKSKDGTVKTDKTKLYQNPTDDKAHWIVGGDPLDNPSALEGLKHLDVVTYWFEYSYQDRDETVKAKTPKYVYIHETEYGEEITESGGARDIILGESLEVKSNQIAYLVPPECLGTVDGKALVGRNPMTTAEYTRLANAEINKISGFKMVDFDKECSLIGNKKLKEYLSADDYNTLMTKAHDSAEYTDVFNRVIKKVFVQTTEGTMVYFYVNFDDDNQSEYFIDYYNNNQTSLQNYMFEYIADHGVRLNADNFTRMTDGNLIYTNGNNSIIVQDNKGHGANLSGAQKDSLQNEIDGYSKSYKALTTKLVLDYSKLADDEKGKSVFENLIKTNTVACLPVGGTGQAYSVDDGTGALISALVVNNPTGTYVYNNSTDPTGSIRIIITNGNVELEKDFSGIIIAGGTVTVKNGVQNIEGNKTDIQRLLQKKITSPNSTDPSDITFDKCYFKDLTGSVWDDSDSGADLDGGDYVPLNKLVTYEEWTKK